MVFDWNAVKHAPSLTCWAIGEQYRNVWIVTICLTVIHGKAQWDSNNSWQWVVFLFHFTVVGCGSNLQSCFVCGIQAALNSEMNTDA